ELSNLVVVQLAGGDGFFEDRRIRRHPPEAVLRDEAAKFAGGHEVAGDVIVPGTLAQLAKACQRIDRHADLRARSCFTKSRACAGVNLNSSKRRSPGAEAPKPVMPSIRPSSVVQRDQPNGEAASMATRARTDGGRTASR